MNLLTKLKPLNRVTRVNQKDIKNNKKKLNVILNVLMSDCFCVNMKKYQKNIQKCSTIAH